MQYTPPEENKNKDLIRYITFILLFISFYLIFLKPPNSETNNQLTKKEEKETTNVVFSNQNNPITSTLTNNNLPFNQLTQEKINKTIHPISNIALSNEIISILFSSLNASIESTQIKNQKGPNNTIIDYNTEGTYITNYATGRVSFSQNIEFPSENNIYKIASLEKNSVSFIKTMVHQGINITIKKKYTLQQNGLLDLNIVVLSDSDRNVNGNFLLYNGANIGPSNQISRSMFNQFELTTLSYVTDDESQDALSTGFFSEPKLEASVSEKSPWIAIDNRFYMRALVTKDKQYNSIFKIKELNSSSLLYLSALNIDFNIAKNQPYQGNFNFAFLPKNRKQLRDLSENSSIRYNLIFRHWSFMAVLTDWIYLFIIFVHQLLSSIAITNFGVAIICSTLLIKLAIFPLTQRSYKSMKKMQDLSPKIEAIRAKNKKQPQKMNLEIMQLYKKEKVNPASGCLPMLIPIPIFFALYSLFQGMTEINNASFLWIKNLAYPDVLFNIPQVIPILGNSGFHLLPILMSVSQWAQTILTPQAPPTGQNAEVMIIQQKMMRYGLPIFFLFICWSLPSALVLYWFVQNIFSIGQTLLLKTKINK